MAREWQQGSAVSVVAILAGKSRRLGWRASEPLANFLFLGDRFSMGMPRASSMRQSANTRLASACLPRYMTLPVAWQRRQDVDLGPWD